MRTKREFSLKLENWDIEAALAKGQLPKPQSSKLILTNWFAARDFFRGTLKLGLNFRKRLLAKQLLDTGYLQWPRKIQALVQGRSVLDFGSGRGLHPLGYIAMGATHATGFDPFVDPDSEYIKSKASGQLTKLAIPVRNIGHYFKGVTFTDDLKVARSHAPYDCVVLHNVTEHLEDLPEAFDEVARLLSSDGFLIFHHHNFYSWDGHHAQPKKEDQIDLSLQAHREIVDWAHIDFSPPSNHPIVRGTLNRITLDDLKAATEERFSILLWQEIVSPEGRGLGRFNNVPISIQRRYKRRDLTIKNVLAVAKLKSN
jgi:SAM-dependent methyltransferase